MVDGEVLWIREWREGGPVHFRIGRVGHELVAEWVGIAELRAKRSGECAAFRLSDGIDDEQASKLRRGAAEALLRHLRGRLSLHASSAARDGDAILFLGDSGTGKSTTVAQLCQSNGFELLADDIAFLEETDAGWHVVPSEDVHWLCADAAVLFGAPMGTEKRPMHATQLATAGARLALTVKLVFDDELARPQARRMGGEAAFVALGSGMLRFALDDRSVDLRDFGLLSKAHATAPMYELRRPRSLEALPEVLDVVLALADKEKRKWR
jgi:hypothetical protein